MKIAYIAEKEELLELIKEAIHEEIETFLQGLNQKTIPERMNLVEAAALLKIRITTLHQYTKLGIIKGSRIGTRVFYNLKDLESSMNEIITSRYAHGKLK